MDSTPETDIEAPIDLFEIPDSVELLDAALQGRYVDINQKDSDGKTILMKSINVFRSDSFILRLLNAGADPNQSDRYGETPLFSSMTRPTITIAEELLQRGAEVNATVKLGHTALHQAIDYNNLEAIALLLFNEADVNIATKGVATPFEYALAQKNIKASELMVNYYDGSMDNVLLLAIKCDINVTIKLVEMGANVNFVNLLELTLDYGNAVLFKLIWARFDLRILLGAERPFLRTYIAGGDLSDTDWLECFYLLLNSSVAFELVQKCVPGTLCKLFIYFHVRSVNLSDRLRILNILISFSINISIDDVMIAYDFFGFNEELEILINFVDYNYKDKNDEIASMLSLILGIEDNFDCSIKPYLICNRKNNCKYNCLGYFSQVCYHRVFETRPHYDFKFYKELVTMPALPSLMELSRASSRQFIRNAFNVKKPYQFFDAVKQLKLPEYIKNIILLKTPIYHYNN